MKKIFGMVLLCMMVFTLAACGQSQESGPLAETESSLATEAAATTEEQTATETVEETVAETATEEIAAEAGTSENNTGNIMIAYFSWSGNTEAVAGMIQEEVGGDLFEIVPAEPYTEDYDALLEIAQAEQQEEARPELAGQVENWDSYDVIFVGYPNWLAYHKLIQCTQIA